jgi:hypothetical protein
MSNKQDRAVTRKLAVELCDEGLSALDQMITTYPQGGRGGGKSNLIEHYNVARNKLIDLKALLNEAEEGREVGKPNILEYSDTFRWNSNLPECPNGWSPIGNAWTTCVGSHNCVKQCPHFKGYEVEGKSIRCEWPNTDEQEGK